MLRTLCVPSNEKRQKPFGLWRFSVVALQFSVANTTGLTGDESSVSVSLVPASRSLSSPGSVLPLTPGFHRE